MFNAYGTFATPALNLLFGPEPSPAVEIVYYVAAVAAGLGLFLGGLKLVRRDLEEKEESCAPATEAV